MSSSVILVKLFARVASLDLSIRFIKGYEIKFPTKKKKKAKKSPLLANTQFFVFNLSFSLTICYTVLFCFHQVLISLNCERFEMPL